MRRAAAHFVIAPVSSSAAIDGAWQRRLCWLLLSLRASPEFSGRPEWPTEERRKAEARSADLRQLSNSLLSELDEAIKQLPGSTGAQKLLVTRVLEHLDRMANDAQGDRQTQLDLVDAYTRLGNLQGNAYDQNLGDPAGALVSLGQSSGHRAAARGLRFARTARRFGRWLWCSSRAARFCGKPAERRRRFRLCGKP